MIVYTRKLKRKVCTMLMYQSIPAAPISWATVAHLPALSILVMGVGYQEILHDPGIRIEWRWYKGRH